MTSLLEFKENDEGEGKYYETCKEKKEIGRDAEHVINLRHRFLFKFVF